MKYQIMSDGAVAEIDTKGAELASLKDVFGTEYIWQGDAKYWKGRAPVLFPIIGEQKGGFFVYGGKSYGIHRHGFAHDEEFDVLTSCKDSIAFTLSSGERTLSVYPFKFRLQISYSLRGTVLSVGYRVLNLDDKDMLFSIGGHTGFNCPLHEDEAFEDYFIEFEKAETCKRLLLNKDGLFPGEAEPFLNDSRSFRLDHGIFDKDAVIPDKLKSKSVTLSNQKSGSGVKVDFGDFDNLAVWSARGEAPFVCLEPWNGRASGVTDGPELRDKYGIITLNGGEAYDAGYTISLL